MKRYRKYELYALDVLPQMGFCNVDVTRAVADWGADIFCEKDGMKYVGQVKMYGTSKTKISRKDVMELHGVMDYFDCDRAFFFYNGKISSDALKAAEKLKVEWIYVDYLEMDSLLTTDYTSDAISIDEIWDKYIKPLEGKELINTQGFSNKIFEVDDACIIRLSQSGKKSRVKKDWFKWIIDRIHHYGYAEPIDLRNEFHCRESSFITLVFREIPLFEVSYNPRTIKFANQ